MNENDIQNPNEMDKPQEETTAVEEAAQSEEQQELQPEAQISDADEVSEDQQTIQEPEMIVEEPVMEFRKKKPMKTGAVIAITAASTLAVCAIALFICYKLLYNPYNANCKYLNTIKDYAESGNMTVDDFKKNFQMPANMPDNTYVAVAEYYLPVSYLAQSNNQDVDTYIKSLGMPEEYTAKITETTTLGELYELYDKYTKENSTETVTPSSGN